MPSSIDASAAPCVPLAVFGLRCVHWALLKLI
jgi:hypothetical protein